MIRIDPDQDLMLSKISWPLALKLIDSEGNSIGLAEYDKYLEYRNNGEWVKTEIYYWFGTKRLCLIVKNSTA